MKQTLEEVVHALAFGFLNEKAGLIRMKEICGMNDELRDGFAKAALAGMSATLSECQSINYKMVAQDAYRLADAMLAARKL